ncbi:hypothetical protein DX928_09245 [Bacillus swezeyi]|nr:hypothetical protein DX928_09245 [Bacillus swezeyi]
MILTHFGKIEEKNVKGPSYKTAGEHYSLANMMICSIIHELYRYFPAILPLFHQMVRCTAVKPLTAKYI